MLISKSKLIPDKTIQISGSKSESNRLLILQKLLGNIEIENISNSQDTQFLQKALISNEEVIDIHHAGTAMRFLTAYFSIQEGRTTILTGSSRMKERPIHNLVTALRSLGADIQYLEKEGFPPLKINGKKINENSVEIPAHISSQFITALILIGAKLEDGLNIHLLGKITSRSYIEMSIDLLHSILNKKVTFEGNHISIPSNIKVSSQTKYTVESDWSSASYFYSMAAIGRENIHLKSFKKNSLQGDAAISYIYKKHFGIETHFNNDESITLYPIPNFKFPNLIELDLNNCPDITQTICVTATALVIPFKIFGLETLKIKETDRLLALQNELEKIGVITEITNNSIQSVSFFNPKENIKISTYNDHRMAMSFAPYSLIKKIEIEKPEVVEKSYPNFWDDFNLIINPKFVQN